MSPTKVVIIVLVIVAVLFAGCMGFGLWRNSGKSNSTDNNPKDYPILSTMNSALAPFAPKVEATSLSPSATTYNLIGNSSYTIKIQPSSNQSFRRLDITTKPSSSCAVLTLTLNDPPKFFSDQPQHASANSSEPTQSSFIVTSGGGELQLKRNTPTSSRCVVTLQVGD